MHADPRGYYAALQVAPDATQQEISRSFRALVRQRHPDVGNPAGGNDVQSVLEAFAVLRNPKSRAAYDTATSGAAASGAAASAAGQEQPQRQGFPAPEPRDIPVRHIRHPGPLLRVSPVRWERGP